MAQGYQQTPQAPILPYARDEASTSQPVSAHGYHEAVDYAGQMGYDQMDESESADQIWPAMQHWTNKRHISDGNPKPPGEDDQQALPWRLRSRLKTLSAVLVLCLNIGVDPPDVVKTVPCAKLECWVDPSQLPSNKAIEAIGRNLCQQLETLSPKVRYKPYLDPSVEETKRFCVGIRKTAKEERVLFYYNGHGVPKPTASGEIWVFNKNYTQYIPVSLFDLQSWLGGPCIYVWECSAAGNVIVNFNRWAERRDAEAKNPPGPDSTGSEETPSGHTYTPFMESIHLAACAANQVLPMSPDLPADLFTCCLTSPIEIALRFFVLQDPLRLKTESRDPRSRITVDLVMKIPGDLKDRRTPLGELNWIFTAVTDTIAWLSFPRAIFNRLFRQDLLVAALFRNFLLANRIMRAYHCTPVSHPELPMTHNHPLWHSWDLAVDACLSQLPDMVDADPEISSNNSSTHEQAIPRPPVAYQQSLFFAEHLQAFEVWLQHGGVTPGSKPGAPRSPPEQLPIVLQVLLSQAHRLRALILLSRFVDLGPWAVHLALSIGIFPYVQKLLQSPAVELKPVLIFIWARILAVDKSCQVDLLKDAGYNYFAHILSPFTTGGPPLLIPNASEHRAMCAFILSMLCRGFRQGQLACMSMHVFESCFARLSEDDWLLKQWCLLCVAQLWADHDEAKALALREGYQDHLLQALRNPAVEVRAAGLYALGTFLGASPMPRDSETGQGGGGTGAQIGIGEREQLQVEAGIAYTSLLRVKEDASPLVRKELVVLLSCVVREWRGWFVCAAWAYYEQETLDAKLKTKDNGGKAGDREETIEDLVSVTVRAWVENQSRSDEEHRENVTILASFKAMFEALLDLSVDPHAEVSVMASTVVDYIVALLIDSAFRRVQGSSLRHALRPRARTANQQTTPLPTTPTVTPGFALSPLSAPPPLARTESDISASSRQTLKRSTSVAHAIRSLATITGFMQSDSKETTSPTSESSASFEPSLTAANHAHYRSPYPAPKTPASDSTPRTPGLESVTRSASIGSLLNAHMRANGGLNSSAGDRFHNMPVSAVAVLEYLTEEDMERLRIRRLKGTQAGGDADGRSANQGVPRPNDLGLGMVAKEVQDDVLPLKSGFFDWSVEYFREPQMKPPDADEPGSVMYNEQTWRRQRNETIVEQSKAMDVHAASSAWNNSSGVLNTDSWPLQLAFHPFDPYLAVTDEADNICIWDWKTQTRVNQFSNCNVPGSSISSVHFVNEMASSLLLTASTEGSIRIFRNYDKPGETALASTFRGVSEVLPVGQSSGVLTSWEQQTGHLLVGGDMKIVRLWDATVERHLRDIATQAGSNLTAITSDEPYGNVFVAGFGDGVVRLFDKRMNDATSVVLRTWRQHHTWIQSVYMQRGSERELVTGSMNGEVRIWDVRAPDSPLVEMVAQQNGLCALAVHDCAPVFATSSAPASHQTRQRILVHGFDTSKPKLLSSVDIPLSPAFHAPSRQRAFSPSASSLAFHPYEMVLAASGFDPHAGTVRLFSCAPPKLQQ